MIIPLIVRQASHAFLISPNGHRSQFPPEPTGDRRTLSRFRSRARHDPACGRKGCRAGRRRAASTCGQARPADRCRRATLPGPSAAFQGQARNRRLTGMCSTIFPYVPLGSHNASDGTRARVIRELVAVATPPLLPAEDYPKGHWDLMLRKLAPDQRLSAKCTACTEAAQFQKRFMATKASCAFAAARCKSFFLSAG